MDIHVKRIDKDLPLPEFKTEGAAGFDLSARETIIIDAHSTGYIPLNVVVEPPQGYFTLLVPRSSLHKRGLMPVNGVGIIDADYVGNDDELKAALYNFTEKSVTVERGERIMQGVFAPLVRPKFIEVEKMESITRGGFGTTGKK